MATYPKGRKWITKFTVDGERHVRTTDTKEAGEAWELAARSALKLGKPIPEPEGTAREKKLGGRDADTLANAVRSAEANHWSRKKSKNASVPAHIFLKWAGEKVSPREAFKEDNLRRFVDYLKNERRNSNATVNKALATLSVLSRYADLDYKPVFPWEDKGGGRVRFFEVEEEALILQTMEQWGWFDYIDFFAFLLDTGLRPWEEAKTLTWDRLTRGQAFIPSHHSKNKKPRHVPLIARAQEVLKRRDRKAKGPFVNIDRHKAQMDWQKLRTALKMPDTVWYTARHTFASRLVMKGVPLFTVAQLMGNSEPIVSSTYAHLSPNYLAGAANVLEGFGVALPSRNSSRLSIVR